MASLSARKSEGRQHHPPPIHRSTAEEGQQKPPDLRQMRHPIQGHHQPGPRQRHHPDPRPRQRHPTRRRRQSGPSTPPPRCAAQRQVLGRELPTTANRASSGTGASSARKGAPNIMNPGKFRYVRRAGRPPPGLEDLQAHLPETSQKARTNPVTNSKGFMPSASRPRAQTDTFSAQATRIHHSILRLRKYIPKTIWLSRMRKMTTPITATSPPAAIMASEAQSHDGIIRADSGSSRR